MTNIIEALKWRYATKKFDPAKKVSDADLNEILESGRLAPTSFGLQPLKFIVVSDAKLREELKASAWNQAQITDSSQLIVLAARTDIDDKFVKKFIEKIAEVRKISAASLKGYEDMMVGSMSQKAKDNTLNDWSARQVYIALGVMLETAALKRIDSCPMEGFDKAKFDEILGLKKENLASVVLMAVGYRAADDSYAQNAKVRFDQKDLVMGK